jgi:prepilin-type processing-associated H-X9-DG protein
MQFYTAHLKLPYTYIPFALIDSTVLGKLCIFIYCLRKFLKMDLCFAQRGISLCFGALFPYCKDESLYCCPTGYRGEVLTYAIMDSMNGKTREGTKNPGIWIKKRIEISQPVTRAVFIDEGWVTPNSFAVHYTQEKRWDDPPVRHGDGTTLSFVDGHAEYRKWKRVDTVRMGTESERGHPGNHYSPTTPQGFQDLYRLQKATWEDLGYVPSH